MGEKKRLILIVLVGAALAMGGTAAPTLAARGGTPNAQSCGGIGEHGGGQPSFEGEFTCDDTGQGNAAGAASGPGPGFPPGTTG
jgi:hypothetical protein